MWAKELTQKFAKPYMSKWVLDHGDKMYHIKAEDREDDGLLTPRANPDGEGAAALEKGAGAQKLETVDSKEKKVPQPNVTNFNFYKRNEDTVLYQRSYEENEPVSFKISSAITFTFLSYLPHY